MVKTIENLHLGQYVGLVYADRVRHTGRYAEGKERISRVHHALISNGFKVLMVSRTGLAEAEQELCRCDWILSLGGDGTQLETARYIGEKPVLGVILFPETSAGFLCACDYAAFLHLQVAPGANVGVASYMRLSCVLNGKVEGRPILNDILLAQACPARASRYYLRVADLREYQCSSGVWISTAIGSHGAIRSAGGPSLPIEARRAAYCVRENAISGKLVCGEFCASDPQNLSIQCEGGRHFVFFDGGLQEIALASGDVVSVVECATDFRSIVLGESMAAGKGKVAV